MVVGSTGSIEFDQGRLSISIDFQELWADDV